MKTPHLSPLHTLVPLSLLLLCPPFAVLLWYTFTQADGSILNLVSHLTPEGLRTIFGPVMFGSKTAWLMIGIFAAFELGLMRLLPGSIYKGPATPKGNVPVYKANGVIAFATTVIAFSIASFGLGLFPATIIYDHFGELIGALNILSLLFCLFLYFKGRYFPSSSDSGHSGNFIFDFYWGTELYPRIFGFDLKMFTNCRFGMMSWSLILLSFAAKQSELFGLSTGMIVAVALQIVYVAKFFWWETGYLSSLDIMHDRAGFYICWGCMVWVPSVYTSATLFMVNHPFEIPPPAAMLLLVAGVVCIFANYFADRQRQLVRQTGGQCLVWGKKPDLLMATYKTEDGETMHSLLLLSGFWGVSRHFHYVPEVLAALCWSLPAGLSYGLPYFYVVFLAVLLVHRAIRDEERCAKKYGRFWDEYCERVPSKIIPGIY
jgi:7-dehydrocholesterol reductase